MDRRDFLQFMGRGALGVGSASLLAPGLLGVLSGCSSTPRSSIHGDLSKLAFKPLPATQKDDLVLAPGFDSTLLIEWGQALNARDQFGFNNDFIGFIPLAGKPDEAYLWVNHETADPQFVSGHLYYDPSQKKTRAQAEKEMRAVGGSILHLQKSKSADGKSQAWKLVENSKINRRLDAFTSIPFSLGHKIQGKTSAIGTLANCSGGVTPWQTFLTCEENYHHYYGEAVFNTQGERSLKAPRASLSWAEFFPYPPEHYGWVVEVDPRSGRAEKLTSLGRFAHEGSTCVLDQQGRCVVYMGDDQENQFFYKFVSDRPQDLRHGTLYVASLEKGEWLPLDLNQSPSLRKHFKTQLEVMIRVREAAALLGATPLDRPEDCEVDPVTKAVILACTNNKDAGRPFGSLLKIEEENQDPRARKFKSEFWKMGGEAMGFACPDNLCFDPAGNLWMTTDISDESLNKPPYEFHGNNSLFVIPMKGPLAGQFLRVASAPNDAEFTGPCFSTDGKTLFLSVQHPGANSRGPEKLTSHWPGGGQSLPKPAVVTIQGPALEALTQV